VRDHDPRRIAQALLRKRNSCRCGDLRDRENIAVQRNRTKRRVRLERLDHRLAALRAELVATQVELRQRCVRLERHRERAAARIAQPVAVEAELLDLGSNELGEESGKEIGEVLKTNTTLTQLSLNGNKLGDAGGRSLAMALRTNTTLTQLSLNSNGLGDEGGKALAEALSGRTLHWLDLSSNFISSKRYRGPLLMGCAASKPSTRASRHTLIKKPEEERDPRWDVAGFNETCSRLNIAWVRVGFLRRWYKEQLVVPKRKHAPAKALHVGAPPSNVQLYCLDYRWAEEKHPDKERHRLEKLVAVLDRDNEAFDEDLVLWDWTSIDWEEGRKAEQNVWWARFANTHFRIKTVVLPDAPMLDHRCTYFESMWCLHGFSASAFTQRIVNSSDPAVSSHTTPGWLLQTDDKLETAFCQHEPDRQSVINIRKSLRRQMLPASTDALGFQTVCAAANFRWVLVSFIHALRTAGRVHQEG